ncbi:MAG: Crp/Fnr family transcriptional regulator [Acidimicrobiales bacterium]
MIFREGEAGDVVLIITDGRVKAFVTTPDGHEVLLSLRGPGELVGELAALDEAGGPRTATVTAVIATAGRIIPGSALRRFLEERPRAAAALLRQLASRLVEADRRRVDFGAYGTTRRVARLLVELADVHGVEDAAGVGVELRLALSQDELAGLVGASRESIARALATLRQHGLVTTARHRIGIGDLDALRSFTG